MIDDSCEVPREDLDDVFNPCRKQVVENGELRQYAHMYDVMNERYDREEDTSYLNSVKRDKINSNTHTSIAYSNNISLYSQNRVTKSEEQFGVLGSSSLYLDKRDDSVMTSKAVVDYVAANIPDISYLEAEIDGKQDKLTLPLSIEQGGTGGNTPYVTGDLDNSAVFVMHDAPNDRYDAAPMRALTRYLDNVYTGYKPINVLANGTDLNTLTTLGSYGSYSSDISKSLINAPNGLSHSCSVSVENDSLNPIEISQYCREIVTGKCWYRSFGDSRLTPGDWILLYPTSSGGGTGTKNRVALSFAANGHKDDTYSQCSLVEWADCGLAQFTFDINFMARDAFASVLEALQYSYDDPKWEPGDNIQLPLTGCGSLQYTTNDTYTVKPVMFTITSKSLSMAKFFELEFIGDHDVPADVEQILFNGTATSITIA